MTRWEHIIYWWGESRSLARSWLWVTGMLARCLWRMVTKGIL